MIDVLIERLKSTALAEPLVDALRPVRTFLRKRKRVLQKKQIVRGYSDSPYYLNVGGGDFLRKHWRVLDYSSEWYHYDEIFIDLHCNLEKEESWPLDDNRVDLIFSGHTLEHLSDSAVRHTLAECKRVLKDDGGIRLSVPDIDEAIDHYTNRNLEWFTHFRPNAQPGALYSSRHGQEDYVLEEYLLSVFATHLTNARMRGTTDEHCVDFSAVREDWERLEPDAFLNRYSGRIRDSWQKQNPGLHRNWFHFRRVKRLLKQAGFENVRRKCSRQSRFVEFCHPEFGNRPYLSLHVEADAS